MSAEEIVARFRAGEIGSKEEATRLLVAGILREKIHLGSPTLTRRICDQLEEDPALRSALERLWRRK
jgi:hypothetical protein